MGYLRHSFFTLASISAVCVGCGGDSDNKGSDNTSTTSPTTSSTTGGTTSAGGTTSTGGSAGDNAGGSAGDGGTSVVVVEDCGYEACGGELADTDWTYSRICVEEDALLGRFEETCSTVELLSSSGEVAGTINFDDDSYNQDVSFSVTAEIRIPADCNIAGCQLTGIVLGAAGLSDVSCVDADGGCVCSGTLEGESTASESDYASNGDNLTLGETEATYCATGNSLKYTGVIEMVPFVYESVPQ